MRRCITRVLQKVLSLGSDYFSAAFYQTYFYHKLQSIPPKRLGQILHCRLRTNCSALNQHLFSKSIVQCSLCACGLVEDTGHFLLYCPLYLNHRDDMLRSINHLCQPSLNILLYGDPNLNDNDNKQIFLSVQKYILNTKRFQANR